MADSNINQIGAYHLADNPNLYEPQRSNNFEFVVTGLDGVLRAGDGKTTADTSIQNASEVIRFSVSQASIPFFSQESIVIKRGNSVMKAAGVPTFDEGSITVNDYIGADSKSVLMAWQNLSYNVKTERVGRMGDYKKTCYLQEYTPDYKQLVRTWTLYGCWVSKLSEDQFNMDDGGKKVITATIQYDKATMDLPNEE